MQDKRKILKRFKRILVLIRQYKIYTNVHGKPLFNNTNRQIVLLFFVGVEVSLVVNVASQCGYTDNHYKSLVRLQELFEETGRFNVLAFPCNQFGKQEPDVRIIFTSLEYFMTVQFTSLWPMLLSVLHIFFQFTCSVSSLLCWMKLSVSSSSLAHIIWNLLCGSNCEI